MSNEIVYLTQSGPHWDWRVALDLFFGGAGVGALIFGILLDEWFRGKYPRICHTAAWLSPVLLIVGLVFLILKMGRPLHLFLTYTHFNPNSPLWWGGVFQPVLLVGAFIYALLWRNATTDQSTRRWLGRFVAPIAAIVGTYHGLLLANNVSRPLWNTGPTVVAAILGFVTTGIAAVMLVHLTRMYLAGRLSDENHVAAFLDDMRVFRITLVAALAMQFTTFFLWWLSLKYGSYQDQQAFVAANETYGAMFWYLGIHVGLVLPILLGGLTVIRGKAANRKMQVTLIAVASVLILVGGLFYRLAMLLGGQAEVPISTFS